MSLFESILLICFITVCWSVLMEWVMDGSPIPRIAASILLALATSGLYNALEPETAKTYYYMFVAAFFATSVTHVVIGIYAIVKRRFKK